MGAGLVLLPLCLAFSLGVGAVSIPFSEVVQHLRAGSEASSPDPGAEPSVALDPSAVIVWQLRLPRALLVMLVGAGLGITGAAYQGLFRNPLADPFVIGASSGAALGATLAIVWGLEASFLGIGSLSWMAFGGTLAAVGLVSLIGGMGRFASPVTLILAGAAVSTMLSAAVSFLMLLDQQSLQAVFSWLMGSFVGRGWSHLTSAFPLMVVGLTGLLLFARPLDALVLGEETAAGLGLDLKKTRACIIVVASLVTAAAVSVSGIIGFVGLVAPHGARLLVGAYHRHVLPASGLLGAFLLLLADDLARTVLAPVEVPVGIITAFLGAPFFLLLLGRRGESVGFE